MATMDMRFISEIQILDIVFLDLPYTQNCE